METKHTHSETYSLHETVSATAYVTIFSTKRPVLFSLLHEDESYGHLQITCIAAHGVISFERFQAFFEAVKDQVLQMFDIDVGMCLPYRDEIHSQDMLSHIYVNIEIFKSSSSVEVSISPSHDKAESSVVEVLQKKSSAFFQGEGFDRLRFNLDDSSDAHS